MTPRKPKAKPDPFPALTCAACRFCLGERDDWECWVSPPRHKEPGETGNNRGEPIDPNWPACFMFIARAQ